MKPFVLPLVLAIFLGTNGAALADDAFPGSSEMALDIEITSGKADVRVEDVPFFGPGELFDAEASIIASLPSNAPFGPGQNQVMIRFWPVASDLGNEPAFRARFRYAAVGSCPDAFSDCPYAIQVEIIADSEQPEGYRLQHMIKGQPLLTAQLTERNLVGLPDGGMAVFLSLDVGLDLPAQQWKQGQQLDYDATTRDQVEDLFVQAHLAFSDGRSAVERELGPMLERLATTVGMSVEEALDTEYAAFTDQSLGFKLQPFDASNSQLVLLGHGLLATLMPSPIHFYNKEYEETAQPLLIYWKDQSGDWQIIR